MIVVRTIGVNLNIRDLMNILEGYINILNMIKIIAVDGGIGM